MKRFLQQSVGNAALLTFPSRFIISLFFLTGEPVARVTVVDTVVNAVDVWVIVETDVAVDVEVSVSVDEEFTVTVVAAVTVVVVA